MGSSRVGSADRACAFLDTVSEKDVRRYEQYFCSLRPISLEDRFRRGLFAFASVHTGWWANCALYELLWDLRWMSDRKLLLARVLDSGAGLWRGRVRNLWRFKDRFWSDPDFFTKHLDETWFECRDRIMRDTPGLGLAKASFFLELTYFHEATTPCMDVHLLRLLGMPGDEYQVAGASTHFVKWAERVWTNACHDRGISPVTARWVYWDRTQRKSDSRYWSKVLEGNPHGLYTSPQLTLFDLSAFINKSVLSEMDEKV